MSAASVAAYASAGDSSLRGLVVFVAGAGVAFVLAGVAATWDDGLTYGPPLLLGAYALSYAGDGAAIDWSAPLVALGLLVAVEFGAWSLELGDGAEERPFARLPAIAVYLAGGLGVSALVLAAGSARVDAGITLWVCGAAAVLALLALLDRLRPASE